MRTVIVEDASRFARELMAQELGITLLISRGVRLLTASGDDLTASDDPTRKMMRQIAGAFAEYEKARLVSKLRHARERVRQEKGKCEGRKPHVYRAAAVPFPVRFAQWHLARCSGLPRGSSGSGLVVATRHDSVPPSVLACPLRFGSLRGRHFRLVLRHQDQLH